MNVSAGDVVRFSMLNVNEGASLWNRTCSIKAADSDENEITVLEDAAKLAEVDGTWSASQFSPSFQILPFGSAFQIDVLMIQHRRGTPIYARISTATCMQILPTSECWGWIFDVYMALSRNPVT